MTSNTRQGSGEHMEQPSVVEVTVRYWAAARAAAGCESETLSGVTLQDVIDAAFERHGSGLATVLTRCAFLVDGTTARRIDADRITLTSGAVVEVLPPFAGG